MGSWQVGLVGNTVIMVAYLGISPGDPGPAREEPPAAHQPARRGDGGDLLHLRGPPRLALAAHAAALPRLRRPAGAGDAHGVGLAAGLWDVIGAVVAVYYWTLRRNYGSLMQGAQLFQDLRQREQQALELNDAVLQGLVVAKMALDLDQPAKANEALTASIASASRIITELLGSQHHSLDLLRSVPAAVVAPPPSRPTAPGRPGEEPPMNAHRAPHPTGARGDRRRHLRPARAAPPGADPRRHGGRRRGRRRPGRHRGGAPRATRRRAARPVDAGHGRPRGAAEHPPAGARRQDHRALRLRRHPDVGAGARHRRRRLPAEGDVAQADPRLRARHRRRHHRPRRRPHRRSRSCRRHPSASRVWRPTAGRRRRRHGRHGDPGHPAAAAGDRRTPRRRPSRTSRRGTRSSMAPYGVLEVADEPLFRIVHANPTAQRLLENRARFGVPLGTIAPLLEPATGSTARRRSSPRRRVGVHATLRGNRPAHLPRRPRTSACCAGHRDHRHEIRGRSRLCGIASHIRTVR